MLKGCRLRPPRKHAALTFKVDKPHTVQHGATCGGGGVVNMFRELYFLKDVLFKFHKNVIEHYPFLLQSVPSCFDLTDDLKFHKNKIDMINSLCRFAVLI